MGYIIVFLIGAFAGFYVGNQLFRARFNEKTKELFDKAVKSQQSEPKKKTTKKVA